jgi:hypothetical protein
VPAATVRDTEGDRHPSDKEDEMSAGSPGEGGEQAPAPPAPPAPGQYGYPPAGQYGYPSSAYYAPAAGATNRVAIAALVCGVAQILGFIVLLGNVLLAVPAVICGAIALRQINARGERGRGMAMAGLVLGILGIVLFVLFLGLLILGLVFARHSS